MLDLIMAPFDSLLSMRELGGPVVDWIFLCSVVMWTIVLERIWYFNKVLPELTTNMLAQWRARPNKMTWASRQIRVAMISRLNSGMNNNLLLLNVLVPMCPLLGLVGTVVGMLAVFDSMAALGSADARSMATGVSEAMICTLSGLTVCMSGLFPVYFFRKKVSRETERLAEKFSF